MHPIFFDLGPITIRTYGVLVAVAFLAAMQMSKTLAPSRGIPAMAIMDLAALCVAMGLLGARLLYVALNAEYFLAHPWDIFKIWEGGLVFYGGFVLAALAAVWWARRRGFSLGATADVAAPGLALGQAIGRIGCFSAGCCYGRPALGLPWSVSYHDPLALAPLGIALHPVQLYEALGCLMISLGLFSWMQRRKMHPGTVFWVYLLLYGILRYSVELFRGDDRGPILASLSPSQWMAAAAVLLAGTVLAVRHASESHGHA